MIFCHGVSQPWTRNSETASQNESFFLVIVLLRYLVTEMKKLINILLKIVVFLLKVELLNEMVERSFTFSMEKQRPYGQTE
jgi:diacylglycerol kinase